jgi:hypothetical protein
MYLKYNFHMRILFLFLFFGLISNSAWSIPQYSLQDLIDIAKRENPILDVLKAKEDAAKSSVVTAESFLTQKLKRVQALLDIERLAPIPIKNKTGV